MPNPCEAYVHDLITKMDFDWDTFLQRDLTDFWTSALVYLETEGLGKEEGFFRKMKYINADEFVAAITCVINKSNIKTYSKSLLQKVSSVFMILLHPDSPDRIRRAINTLLLGIIKGLNEINMNVFNSTLCLIVPWSKWARNDVKDNFAALQKIKHVATPPEKQPKRVTETNPAEYLQTLVAFLLRNWEKMPASCCRITIESLISIVYMPQTIKANLPKPLFGFNNPPPADLNECVMKNCIDKLVEANADLKNIALTQLELSLFLEIFKLPINFENEEIMAISVKFVTALMRCRNDAAKCTGSIDPVFYDFLDLVSMVIDHTRSEETLSKCNDFFQEFVKIVMENISGQAGYNLLIDLIDKHKINEASSKPNLGVIVFLNVITYCLSVKENEENVYNFITTIIKKGRLYIGALMKYARYMAVFSLPGLIKVDYNSAKDLSAKHVMRKTRTKQLTKRDWFAQNCEMIFTKPEAAKPEIETTLFLEENKKADIYSMPPLKIAADDNSLDYVQKFLNIIERFANEKDKVNRQCMFAPFIAFHSALSTIRYPPVGIEAPNDLFFFNGERLLLQEAKTEDDAFYLLQKEMATADARMKTSKEVHIEWQNAIKTKLATSLGISAAVSAITTGEYNALSLVNDVISAISDQTDIKESHLDFVKLYPLFTADQKRRVVDIFNKWVPKCNSDVIGPTCLYFMVTDKSLRRVMMNNLLVCCRKNSIPSLNTLTSAVDFIEESDLEKIIDMVNMKGHSDNLQEVSSLYIAAAAAVVKLSSVKYATKLIEIIQANTVNQNLPEDFITHVNNLISYVLVYSHPLRDKYRFSNLSTYEINDKSRVFSTNNNCLVHAKPEENGISLETEELSGHFHFNYKKISTCGVNNTRKKFAFNKVVKSSYEAKDQDAFTSNLFNIFNIKEAKTKDEPVEANEVRFNLSTPIPESTTTKGVASVLQGIGLYQPSNVKISSVVTQKPLSFHFNKLQAVDVRIQIKCALIYASETICTQNQILGADISETSPQFREFVSNIGHSVDMGTHTKYDGLLKHSPNVMSSYYSDEMFETMFHVSPLLESRPDDPQQVYKKRHIGNDYITIVWCEAGSFDTQVITSQFNFVHIIIYTLPSGYYCVETHKKESKRQFGPLTHIAVCDKNSLYDLVRKTVVEAQLSINLDQSAYKFPTKQRNLLISSILNDRDEENYETRDLVFF